MKERLRELYVENKRAYDIWVYLWLFSDSTNKSIEFSHTELSYKFEVPMSTLNRILKQYTERWNSEKIYVNYVKSGYKRYTITFYSKGKQLNNVERSTIYDTMFDWLKTYYYSKDFEYSDLRKHKRYVKIICDKLTKAMKDKDVNVNNDSLFETFQFFFDNIPDWWVDNGNITLTTINKSFTKILNQIKSENNGRNKSDSYSKAAESATAIDFDKLAAK
jgi:hypothetical protein